ncbi:S24 family peptidase [Hydrogenophaga defluvii]|uniref:Helix-turn-helix transcriptional regulator n=1 Tax=Hydrogenophaga defluvii TaxID=249410 RepID=A0ABW2SC45_9BURK
MDDWRMDKKLRLQALLGLLRERYCSGNGAELGRRIETDGTYINRLFYEPGKPGGKNVGPDIMDKATRAFNLPRGFWEMDLGEAAAAIGAVSAEPPTNVVAAGPTSSTEVLSLPATSPDTTDVVIHQYGTGGAMGTGLVLQEQPGIIKEWRVSDEWLRLNVPHYSAKKNLAIVTGFGPSMKPMFNPGDPLLVDTGVKVVDHEGVYFFRVGEEGFIKIVQRVPEFDGPGFVLRIISKNEDYKPYDISPKNPHFEVLGKVLTVWRSEQH